MKPIRYIPDRLLLGRWDNRYYILYSGVMSNSLSMPSVLRLIRRTLLIEAYETNSK